MNWWCDWMISGHCVIGCGWADGVIGSWWIDRIERLMVWWWWWPAENKSIIEYYGSICRYRWKRNRVHICEINGREIDRIEISWCDGVGTFILRFGRAALFMYWLAMLDKRCDGMMMVSWWSSVEVAAPLSWLTREFMFLRGGLKILPEPVVKRLLTRSEPPVDR